MVCASACVWFGFGRHIERYGALRPLVLVVKYLLSQRQLNDTYSGGIGSFMLTMMALHVVQQVGRVRCGFVFQ